MDKLIKSKDGYLWIDVTENAQAVFDTGLFNLQAIWSEDEENSVITRVPIDTQRDVNYALQKNKRVCIYAGELNKSKSLGFVNKDSYSSAHKIVHEGHLYVRFKDLLFGR